MPQTFTPAQKATIIGAIVGAVALVVVALINKPPPTPWMLTGNGTAATNPVSLPRSHQHRTVRLVAKAECLASVGGQMQVTVSGAGKPCESGTVYRTPRAPELLAAEIACSDDVPAGEERTYLAGASNKLADARTVHLEVTPYTDMTLVFIISAIAVVTGVLLLIVLRRRGGPNQAMQRTPKAFASG